MDAEAKIESEMAIIDAVFQAEAADAAQKNRAWRQVFWKLAVLTSGRVHVSGALADFLYDHKLRETAKKVCKLAPNQPGASRIFAAIDLLEIRSKVARTESVNAAVFHQGKK